MLRLKRLMWFAAIWATSVFAILAIGQVIRLMLNR